ncbi:MAG: NTP transferase domain-containing protein [Bacteroidetes bacterium]|nr:NTP transferase domain-containing protein [Bacteroidota bacterium]
MYGRSFQPTIAPTSQSAGATPIGSNSPLLGLVLCGGESRRMGQDKGLMKKDGVPWALHMGQKLHRLGIPVVYSVNSVQVSAYSGIIPEEQLVVDALQLPGPLNGLFTTHRRYPDPDILLLACDMLDMDAATLETLIACYRGVGGYEFYAYEEGAWLQPFGAIYTAAGLERVGAPADGRLQNLLRAGRTKRLVGAREEAFNNYNTLSK